MLDVDEVRRDFPILKSGLVYLDNAASTLTPERVLQKMLEYYRSYRANVFRGVHSLSRRATEEYEQTREEVRKFINARHVEEIIFVKNTTEGINCVARGLSWERGDRIVSTILEHHSNLVPWQRVVRDHGVELKLVRPDRQGYFQMGDFEEAIDERTRLVAISHVSNVLGCRLPVEQVARIARERGALLLVDGAQSVPHMPVDVQELKCDFLVFSGHKMLGPTGVGVLYVRKEVQEGLEPLTTGGGMVEDVGENCYSPLPGPHRYEAGTPPIAEVIGLGEAIRYLQEIGLQNVAAHEKKLTREMLSLLLELGVEVYGPMKPEDRIGLLSFNLKGVDPHQVALALDRRSIIVRSGHHCAIPLHTRLLKAPRGSVRASVYLYNGLQDVESLIDALGKVGAPAGI